MTHPSLLDFGPEQFFEKHLAYIAGRPDVWYVPTGPLYAYRIVRENTVVTPLGPKDGWERFAVHHDLDPKIYDNAVTLTFAIPASAQRRRCASGARPLPREDGEADRPLERRVLPPRRRRHARHDPAEHRSSSSR